MSSDEEVQAIRVERTGGPEVLQLKPTTLGSVGPDQMKVGIRAAGVNFIDIYFREGSYQRETPFTIGLEGAGEVLAVGSGVSQFRVGDRVAWENVPGSYAEQVVGPAAKFIPVPDDVSDLDAAAFPLQGLTAQYLTSSTYPVRPGDDVLIHAGAGGVGQLLIQVAKLLGARVISTASSAAKQDLARAAGADDVIGYDGFDEVVKDLTGGAGVAAVFDGVGKDTFDRSLNSVKTRGTMVLFGAASGQPEPVDPRRLAARSLFLTRPTLAHHVQDQNELLERAAQVLGWIAAGQLAISIGATYPLADAAQAQQDLAARKTTGKLLLIP